MSKKSIIVSLIMNSINSVIVFACFISYFISFDGGFHFVKSNCLVYFTTLSALLAAAASVPMAVFCSKNLSKKKPLVPKFLSVLKLTASTAEMLTFAVVLCMQLPALGISVYTRQSFFLHLVTPLLTVISYAAFEKSVEMPRKLKFFGLLPIVLYSILYLTQVVVLKNWMDFYSFNIGGFWYISAAIIFGISYFFASFLWEANHHKRKKKSII